MINFDDELKKFFPSLEVEDIEEVAYNQDMTDMADMLIKTMMASGQKSEEVQ